MGTRAGRQAAVLVLVVLGWSAGAAAQDTAPVSARLAPGVVLVRSVFGDDSPRSSLKPGFSLGAQLCGPRSGGKALVTEAMVWTSRLENPHGGEHVRMLHLQTGPQFGERTYLRATLGVAVQFWTEKREKGLHRYVDIGLAASLAAGGYLDDRRKVAAEAIARLTVSPGFATMSVGAQMPFGPCTR